MKTVFLSIQTIALSTMIILLNTNKTLSGEKNLVTNPSFETGGKAVGQEYNQNGWTFFVIEEPAEGKISGNAKNGKACFEMRAEKGRGFLHSDVFPVTALSDIRISAWIKGSGTCGVEMLWWKEYNDDIVDESEHHRDILKEFEPSDSWKKIDLTVKVPTDAKYAYIRFTAKGGNVCFDDIVVK